MKFLGHPLSLDTSMSGNGSCWSQFYNGWGWSSSMTSSHHFMEFDNSERLRSMELWFSCYWDVVKRKENFNLPFLFCQQHQSRKEWEELITTVCFLKACNPLWSASPKCRDLHGLPKGVHSQVHGDKESKRKSRSFVNTLFSSILYTGISWYLTNAKKESYFYHYWSQFGCHFGVFI